MTTTDILGDFAESICINHFKSIGYSVEQIGIEQSTPLFTKLYYHKAIDYNDKNRSLTAKQIYKENQYTPDLLISRVRNDDKFLDSCFVEVKFRGKIKNEEELKELRIELFWQYRHIIWNHRIYEIIDIEGDFSISESYLKLWKSSDSYGYKDWDNEYYENWKMNNPGQFKQKKSIINELTNEKNDERENFKQSRNREITDVIEYVIKLIEDDTNSVKNYERTSVLFYVLLNTKIGNNGFIYLLSSLESDFINIKSLPEKDIYTSTVKNINNFTHAYNKIVLPALKTIGFKNENTI